MAASIVLVVERVAPVPPATEVAAPGSPITSARLSAGDVAVELSDRAAVVTLGDASFALTTERVGDATLADPVIEQHDSRITNRWPSVDEWYRDRDGMIEHGYTIDEPVSGPELVVEVAVDGAQPIAVDDRSVVLSLADGSLVSYRDLVAFDADGRDLDAAMSIDGSTVVLTVDVADASYPVTIDPIITEDQVLRSTFAGDEFGTSVAVDGDRMAVGVPGALTVDGGGAGINTVGIVRLYTRAGPGTVWTPDGILVNPSPSYSEFGQAVSVSGDRVAVGAANFTVGPFADEGAVLVYERTGSWGLVDTATPGGAGSYGFGYSVDFIDADRIVIGAPGFVEGAGDQAVGQVFLYVAGVVTAIPTGATTGLGDDMGYSVAGDIRPGGGIRVVVGAPGNEGDNGLFRVLDNPGAGWSTVYGLSGGVGARMGSAVDVSGDRVAHDSINNVNVYATTNLGASWANEVISSVARGSFPAPFNRHFDLEGGTLAVGAPGSNLVQIFRYDGFTWGGAVVSVGADTLEPAGADGTDAAGYAVAVDGNTMAVGAPGDDGLSDATADSGAVYAVDVPLIANFTFPSDTYGDWGDPANWDVGTVPGGPDDLAIIPDNTYAEVVDVRAIDRLLVDSFLRIGDRLSVSSAAEITSSGYVFVDPGGRFDLPDQLQHDGSLNISDGAMVVAIGNRSIVGAGAIDNDGEVTSEAGGTLTTGPALTWSSGTTGVVFATDGSQIDIQGAYDAQGITAAKAGSTVSIAGNLDLTDTSEIQVDVHGPSTNPADYGRIEVGGSLFLGAGVGGVADGTIRAVFDTYTPTASDSYPVITCAGNCNADNEHFAVTDTGNLDTIWTTAAVLLEVVPNKIVSPDAGEQRFGAAVDVEGDWLIVGGQAVPGGNAGRAYLYEKTGSEWTLRQTFTSTDDTTPGGAAGDQFGRDVAVGDNYLAISSPVGNRTLVYYRATPGVPFTFLASAADSDGDIDIVGDRLLVGPQSSAVYVHDLTPVGLGVPAILAAPGGVSTSWGASLALGGDLDAGKGFVAVGDPGELPTAGGSVWVYPQSAPSTFGAPTQLISPDGSAPGDRFGNAVDASGDRLAVGEWFNDLPSGDAGRAWVFDWDPGTSSIASFEQINAAATVVADTFGSDVAIDGETLFVGAGAAQKLGFPFRDGAGYLFRHDGSNWLEVQEVRAPDGHNQDRFGDFVALSGDNAVAGTWLDDNVNGAEAGAVYTYDVEPPTTLTFDLGTQVGSESVLVATQIAINQLNPAATVAGSQSTLAASSIAALAADDPQATPLTSIRVGSTPLTSIVLDSEVLSAISLVNIDIDGGWERIIAGSELENEPLASLTFGQVLSAGSPTEPNSPSGRFAATPLTSIEVDGTPLTSITLGAIVLGGTPLTSIPLTSIDPNLDWCDIVAELVPQGQSCDDAFLETLSVLEVTLRGVPLTSIPLTSIPLTSIDLLDSPLTSIPLTSIDLFQTPLTSIPLTSIPLTSIGVENSPLTSIPLTSIPASAVPLTSIPLTSIGVLGSPLTSIRADATPLTSIDPSGAPLTSIQLEGTALLSLPLTSIVLMDAPLTSIPLTPAGGTPQEIEDQWCALLEDTPLDDGCDTTIDPATTTLRELFVRGLPLTSIPFESIPLTSIDVSGLPLTSIGLDAAPLTSIPVGGVPLTSISVTYDDGTGPVATPLTSIPLTSIDVVDAGLIDTPLTSIGPVALPLTSIAVDALPLTSIPLLGAPLTSIVVGGTPLTSIELSAADLTGTRLTSIELSGLPLTSIDCSAVDCDNDTLADALAADALVGPLTVGDLQAGAAGLRLRDLVGVLPGIGAADLVAALAGLTLADWTDLDGLTLGDLPGALLSTFGLTLGDLGAALTLITFGDLVGNLLDPTTGQPLPNAEAELRAAVDALGLTLGELTTLDDVTLGDLIDGYLGATPLTLRDIPTVLGFITLAALEDLLNVTFDLTGLTLGDLTEAELGALTLGDLVPLLDQLGLGDLLAAIDDELANYTLGDLLLALVDPSSLALGGVDFVDVDSAALPAGTVPPSTFEATFELGGSRTRAVVVEVRLPANADFVPGSGAVSDDTGGGAVPLAPVVDGDVLRWAIPADPGTEYTVEFDVLPSLRLGSTPIGATATVVGTDVVIPSTASVDVQEGAEPNDFPQTVLASEDVIYLTYISTPTDNDVYEITVAEDDELVVQLSNLGADFDLVLWGDPVDDAQDAPLSRTSDEAPIIPVTDPDAEGADAEPLDDFVRLDELAGGEDLGLVAVSNRPGRADEVIRTGRLPAGTYYIQVYGSNGATNLRPAAFQVAVIEADVKPDCVAVDLPPLGAAGAVAAVGPDANTLILVNESRLEQYYGAQARQSVTAAIGRLEAHLANDPSINPVTVSVDGVGSVAAAYAAWDADPCNPNAANAIVSAINADVIDPVRGQLEHVVILGGDELIPMARLADATEVANEYDYRYEFQGDLAGADPDGRNALTSAQWESAILSDDPYGDGDARSLGDRFLYVTDVALGRVVESPADIVDALDTFVTYDGTLAIDTAAVLGYDFLVDGSEAVASTLAAVLPNATDDELADGLDAGGQPWDRVDATDVLDRARQNALISLNAHFDHYRALPAIGDKVPGFTDLLIAEDAAAELGQEALERSLIFSAGCHSGLQVSDVLITTTSSDWAEILSQQGALFVGNTGFGYGDTEAVAYTEQLMALFANQVTAPFDLDPSLTSESSTVGQALAWAKNEYVAGLQTLSVYDEKAVMESTFYGLPFYRVGLPTPLEPLPPPPANTPVAGELAFTIDPTNDANPTPSGTYFSNSGPDGEQLTIVAPGRPIQPKQLVDVSVVGNDPTKLTQIAHGAIIESMTSTYVDLPDPVVASPIFDESNSQPEPELLAGAFPTRPLAITSSVGPEGQRQALVTATGQYRSGPGIQRLDDDITASVYYADPTETDFTPPRIGAVDSALVAGALQIRLTASDGPLSGNVVDRVHVLVAVDPGIATVQWTGIDLVNTPATDEWTGSLPLPLGASGVEFIVSAKDSVGNVGFATNKALNFGDLVTAPPPVGGDLEVSLDGIAGTGGWFDGPVTVTVTGSAAPLQYFVDGVGPTTITSGGSFGIGVGGPHSIRVVSATGEVETRLVRIDDDGPPVIDIRKPITGSTFVTGSGARLDVACTDRSLDQCRRRITRTDLLGASPQAVAAGSPLPTQPGTYELRVRATDKVGNETIELSTFTISALVGPPELIEITGPSTPQEITETVTIDALFNDVSAASDDYSATVDWGDGTTTEIVVPESDEPSPTQPGTLRASHLYAVTGVYSVTVTVRDDDGGEDVGLFEFVVVFDPTTNGRVSGAGFYWSGPEAYAGSGPWGSSAFFGYRARYKNGDALPSGQTKLRLVGEFFFRSTAYDYLIVNDTMAIAEGVGSMGGPTEYRFRVQGIDNGWIDFFQISIWDDTTGEVLYDNGILYDDGDLVLLGGIRVKS